MSTTLRYVYCRCKQATTLPMVANNSCGVLSMAPDLRSFEVAPRSNLWTPALLYFSQFLEPATFLVRLPITCECGVAQNVIMFISNFAENPPSASEVPTSRQQDRQTYKHKTIPTHDLRTTTCKVMNHKPHSSQ